MGLCSQVFNSESRLREGHFQSNFMAGNGAQVATDRPSNEPRLTQLLVVLRPSTSNCADNHAPHRRAIHCAVATWHAPAAEKRGGTSLGRRGKGNSKKYWRQDYARFHASNDYTPPSWTPMISMAGG